jgi:glycosyltransferase involved in cell wall biosynthesis
MTPLVTSYLRRFGFCPGQVSVAPEPGLGLIVVIPCHNEPSLNCPLDSLWRCTRPNRPAEVIVVINSSADDPAEIVHQNEETHCTALAWIGRHQDPGLRFHLIHAPGLPPKHAGVGLARKIGMDEALRRFDVAGTAERHGVIACFDADCACDANYLAALDRHFLAHPDTPGCSIYFEHPLEGPLSPEIYRAGAAYELHLRYYVEALRFAGLPFAFHTVGSAMAVTAEAYRKQGGMNKRQAGEDFYFLHKIIQLGNFTELNTTRVSPSPRPSDRVPFGTGKAVRAFLDSGSLNTYPLQAFDDLRQLTRWAASFSPETMRNELRLPNAWPALLTQFLARNEFPKVWETLRTQTATLDAFRKRFSHWFDAFRAMKYIHHARDNGYGTPPVAQAAAALLSRLPPLPTAGSSPDPASVDSLLDHYRLRSKS